MASLRFKRRLAKLVLALFMTSLLQGISLLRPATIGHGAGSLTVASATLANPRMSFYGKVSGIHLQGVTTIATDTDDNPDNTTNHLFPGDPISVGPNGALTVGSIIGVNNFALTSGLIEGVSDQATIYATQSGALTVTFTITNDIPAAGYVKVTIPDAAADFNDGAPDTAASVVLNGFDFNGMAKADVVTTGGTGCTWAVDDASETFTVGNGTTGHIYKNITSTACTAGAITVTFDGASKDLINPAPITGHTPGTADVYALDIDTYDTADQLIDTADVKVAPVEGVLVSATVDETLSFAITAVGVGVTACGQPADIATTVTSVPFGLISTVGSFIDLSHDLQVSTNANGGYTVKVAANDQMGLNGGACAGDVGEANDCIKDTTCDGATCTHLAAALDDWETATINGLGYSLESSDGSDAAWEYDDSDHGTCDGAGEDFCASQFADTLAAEVTQTIMSNIGPVSSKNIWVCYRLSISNTQPAGYYYNNLKYTATATF